MTIPKETIDKIKADAKAYMHNEIKGMVGDEELQPYHLEYAHEAGATEWAGKGKLLADAIMAVYEDGAGKQSTIDLVNKGLMSFYGNQKDIDNALAKYKEVGNG